MLPLWNWRPSNGWKYIRINFKMSCFCEFRRLLGQYICKESQRSSGEKKLYGLSCPEVGEGAKASQPLPPAQFLQLSIFHECDILYRVDDKFTYYIGRVFFWEIIYLAWNLYETTSGTRVAYFPYPNQWGYPWRHFLLINSCKWWASICLCNKQKNDTVVFTTWK